MNQHFSAEFASPGILRIAYKNPRTPENFLDAGALKALEDLLNDLSSNPQIEAAMLATDGGVLQR